MVVLAVESHFLSKNDDTPIMGPGDFPWDVGSSQSGVRGCLKPGPKLAVSNVLCS